MQKKLACKAQADCYLKLDVSMHFDYTPSSQCLNTLLVICLAEAVARSEVRMVQDQLCLDYLAYSLTLKDYWSTCSNMD